MKRPDYLVSFGRRLGRKLTVEQQKLLGVYLPEVEMKLSENQHLIKPADYFGNDRPLWLEIGFGGGEHLLHLALRHPQVNFIGGEPFYNGVVKLLREMQKRDVSNIRVVADDIRPIMQALPDGSLERIYILFPDPWPKTRHHKRRIINHRFLDEVVRLLPQGGELRLATDHVDYSVWMLEHLLARPEFDWSVHSYQSWQHFPEDWIETRYEKKTRQQGRSPVYLIFVKR